MGSISPPPHTTSPLDAALHRATKTYTLTHPLSRAAHTRASIHLPGGNTRTVLYTAPFPLTFASASGSQLHPLDHDPSSPSSTSTTTSSTNPARPLTDFLSEYTAAIYGHSHPVIATALSSALSKGWNYGGHGGHEGTLARLICERFADRIEMVRFVNSGTEANVLALATAVAWTGTEGGEGKGKGNTNVLVFDKGYHGSVISGRMDRRRESGQVNLNLPYRFIVGRYNCGVEEVRRLVREGVPEGERLAAILVEPMLGSGGCFVARGEFLRGLRTVADEVGALLIFDEVMTSRLGDHGEGEGGRVMGGLARAVAPEVRPDLMTLGKWVGGGMSFGAFGGRKEIMEWFDPAKGRLQHPGTFNNNVFTMAAGCAGVEQVLTAEVLKGLNERGERLKEGLRDVLKAAGLGGAEDVASLVRPLTDDEQEDAEVYSKWPVMFVKGEGSLLCVHFTGPEKAKLHQLFWLTMVEKGFWIAARGFIALNIELTDEDVKRFIAAMESFVKQYHDLLKR